MIIKEAVFKRFYIVKTIFDSINFRCNPLLFEFVIFYQC